MNERGSELYVQLINYVQCLIDSSNRRYEGRRDEGYQDEA